MQKRSFLSISTCVVGVLLLICDNSFAQEQDTLLNILQTELKREWDSFQKVSTPPYYIDYNVHDLQYISVESSFGSLIQSNEDKSRLLKVNVRIGDYQFDNSHQSAQGGLNDYESLEYNDRSSFSILPFENDADAIQYSAWTVTQNAYRAALEQYKFVKSPTTQLTPTLVPDFSKEEPSKYYEAPIKRSSLFDKKRWEDKTRQYSSRFLQMKEILSGEVLLSATYDREYFISTEGSQIVQNVTHYYLYINASIRAEDGDVLPLHKSYFAYTPDQLPNDEVIERDIRLMMEKLGKLRTAPIAEPYTGPAILQAQAAGVFFHEIFGHRIEGHRLKDEMDGQTFRTKVNEPVLPSQLSVIFDPTLSQIDSKLLNGSYKYDNEGVKSQRVVAVDKGVLKQFLISRSPLDKFTRSNGHGRGAPGAPAVSRQSNLIVEASKQYSMDDLRKLLIKECKKQGKKYGYLFNDVVGGFTNTQRFTPNAFNIFPTEVYRIYADGRPDEMVRGVDLIGTPLAMFAEISAAGNERQVFNGFCGAESGNVPVSAVSPALFVKRIETQKKPKAQQDTTILTRPLN